MPKRRIELPTTLEECHTLIIELYDLHDEQKAYIAELERELYGCRRERFIDGVVDDDSEQECGDQDDGEETTPGDLPGDVPSSPSNDIAKITLPSGIVNDTTDDILDVGESATSFSLPLTTDAPESSARRRRTSKGRKRRVIPPQTQREKVFHPLDEATVPPEILHHPNARRFHRFVREEIEMPQRRIRVIEHYQEVIALDDEKTLESRLYVAPVPAPLLDRCFAGSSLLAYLAVSRFTDHIPYYRVEEIFQRSGVFIHRSTQWRWMHSLSKVLSPLVNLIRKRLLTSQVLGIDETPCPILDPALPHTRSAYLYAQYGDASQPYVGYYFANHKTRANIEPMLSGFQGTLLSDAYICYELITAASLDRIQPAACWVHGRRKFESLLVNGKHPQASWILREIQRLYDIEDRAREMTDDERLSLRQLESRPIVESIHSWLQERQAKERPRSVLRKAANYFLKRWNAFTRFLENGAIPMDNNHTESVIRGPVMGKKAWLFLGNERAGETAAIMYTVMMSCKRHHVDPYLYLCDILPQLGNATPEQLESFLPDKWIESHPEARIHQRAIESHAAAYRKRMRRLRRRAALAKQ